MDEYKHIPVLLYESIEGLNIKPDGIYVDGDGDGNYSCYEYPEQPDYGPEDGWRY